MFLQSHMSRSRLAAHAEDPAWSSAVETMSLGDRQPDRPVDLKDAPNLRAVASGQPLFVAELKDVTAGQQISSQVVQEDAFYIDVHLDAHPAFCLWENGMAAASCDLDPGDVVIWDLSKNPQCLLDRQFHAVRFYIPRATFDAVADGIGAPRIAGLFYRPGQGMADAQAKYLAILMLAELQRPESENKLFADCIAQAFVTHIAQTYGGLALPSRPIKGGLAPWQTRRAKEMLCAALDGGVELRDVARECGLSLSHFSRAFRQSVGLPPHGWIVKHRLKTATRLMRDDSLTLSAIALACGFADQSHFTRAFKREMGTSPGAWRRCIAR